MVWNYLSENGNKLICIECKVSLVNNGNTSSMKKHIGHGAASILRLYSDTLLLGV